jgi:hypothetical protein
VVSFRSNAGITWVEHPGDYANRISTAPASAPVSQKSGLAQEPAEKFVKDIRRATRRHFSAEDKIRVVLEGLRDEESIAELCHREGIFKSSTIAGRRTFSNDGAALADPFCALSRHCPDGTVKGHSTRIASGTEGH